MAAQVTLESLSSIITEVIESESDLQVRPGNCCVCVCVCSTRTKIWRKEKLRKEIG